MKLGLPRLASAIPVLALAMWLISTFAFAQGGGAASSLSGTIVDASGGVIPGATVTVRDNATATEYNAVSMENGTFTVPAINPGSYTVTVTLMGFKTAVLSDVRVNAAVPATVRVTLEIGGLEETVVVQGESVSLVQTQSAAIATTMDVNQISNLPLTSRSALDFVINIPGVNTPAGSRDSTINGLPQSAINITIDGMSVQDNYLKTSDGFFARVSPRIDTVEEVTVSSAAQGAESTGQGAVQIRFSSRSGTNELRGSSYHYLRADYLNANTWFRNRDLAADPATAKAPKDKLRQYQPGTRVGGPIVIPKLFDGHNKAFFFMNYEESRTPSNPSRNRVILHPRAEQGWFRYDVGGGNIREVNVLQLAGANGHIGTIDPVIAKVLADIRASTSQGTVVDLSDPRHQQLTYQFSSSSKTIYPSGRVDVNLTDRHRFYSSFNYNKLLSSPDTTNNREPRYPGFPATGVQDSLRYTVQGTVRSTLSSNLVNEFRVGGTGGRTLFYPGLAPGQFTGSLANQAGFLLDLNNSTGIANAASTGANSAREASTKVIDNSLTWIKGAHSFNMGVNWTQADVWLNNRTVVPTIQFGVASTDPIDSLFNTGNFAGANTTQLNNARGLYAALTGRISAINGTARLDAKTDEYVYGGLGRQEGRMRQIGMFMSDAWRVSPNFTMNWGLRYEMQLPFYPLNNSYSIATVEDIWGISGVGNLFKPGTTPGSVPSFKLYEKGQRAFGIDWNNFAPNLGLAWTVGGQSGILGAILGQQGDSVLRAGYSLGYDRYGMSDYTDVFGANPGISLTTNRNHTIGNLGTAGQVLLRNTNQLGPPSFPTTRVYPMSDVITGDISAFDPNLSTPYSQSWQAGWQRRTSKHTMFEIRYVGTRSLQSWIEYDYNEVNIIENGFLDEFRNAQRNLEANIAAGRGANFRYFGAGTGTVPLPIFLAYFAGLPASQAGSAANYSNSLFANSTFVNPLARFDPQPFTAANALDADQARINNAIRAGLPRNFLVANPDYLGGASLFGNGGYTRYDSLQLEARRRLSGGLQIQGSYVYGKGYASNRYSFRTPRKSLLDTGTVGGLTHAFKANWVYDMPFGRDRKFGGGAGPLLDRLIGGWSFDGITRIQSGRMLDFGNVRLVGMTASDLQKAFTLRFDDANRVVYMLPDDIIENTVKAFSVSATSPTGYGTLGPPSGRYMAPANGPDCIETAQTNRINGFGACGVNSVVVTGPWQVRFDLSAVKRLPIKGRVNFELRGEFLNAFNHPWFTPVLGSADNNYVNRDNFRVTGLSGETAARVIQIVTRLNW